jgi:HAD superfamily hydrolase (TIGR01549 family)
MSYLGAMAITGVKAVLFDLDDTLYDRAGVQDKALEIIVKKLPVLFKGIEMERISAAFYESDMIVTVEFDAGAPLEGLRDRRSGLFLRALGLPEEYAVTITRIYMDEYPKLKSEVPGAVATVRSLVKSYKVGIVSNGFADVQHRKLETLELLSDIPSITLSDETGLRKPDPEIFIRGALQLEINPSECLYVGDSYVNDIIGAANAGMLTCWFNRENKTIENPVSQPDFIITELKELINICK